MRSRLLLLLVTACAAPADSSVPAEPLLHVQPIAADQPLLWVDFAAIAPETDDARAQRALTPLLGEIAELSLARTRIGDPTLALCARMPELRRLDLRDTQVTDAGLLALRGHPRLEDLVLTGTKISAAARTHLEHIPKLTRVAAFATPLAPPAAVAGAKVLEEEPELRLSSDAPLPDGSKAKNAVPASPNAMCPITGKLVDPRFTLTVDGQVLGFCCGNCKQQYATQGAAAKPASDPAVRK